MLDLMNIRVIPCLQLLDDGLVKTTRFENPKYIGDPVNTVRIFNELEVDELCFLDIRATVQRREPGFPLLQQIADECFMPLSYGGGIATPEQARKVFRCGFEKIIIGSAAFQNPDLVRQLSELYGSQAVIVAIDVKKNLLGHYMVMSHSATGKTGKKLVEWAQQLAELGAGEILLTSVNNEGTWKGFDVELINTVSRAVPVPVIAHGGAGSAEDFGEVAQSTQAGAVAAGSFFVYQKKGMGVLINFPKEKIEAALLQKHPL